MIIVFEGPDGCGKTTALNYILKTCPQTSLFKPEKEYKAFAADMNKAANVGEEVEAIVRYRNLTLEQLQYNNATEVVLLDRYYHSTFVYQFYTELINKYKDIDKAIKGSATLLEGLEDIFLEPDITIVFTLDKVETLKQRCKAERLQEIDASQRSDQFWKHVIQAYHKVEDWDVLSRKIKVIDSESLSLLEIMGAARKIVIKALEQRELLKEQYYR